MQSRRGKTDRSHPDLVQLDALARSTTYPGWQKDFQKAEEAHFSYGIGLGVKNLLHILKEKQRVHKGDRSHPRLKQLDALTITYPDFQEDVSKAEDAHFKDLRGSFLEHLKNLQNKQAAFMGDRSHPDLVKLDSLAKTTTYPGWEVDFKNAEKAHFSYAIGLGFDHLVHILVEKQRVHIGDRSHPRLQQLDAVSFTYPGFEKDVKKAEEAHFKNLNGAFMEHFKTLQNKQAAFVGDRSHTDLVKLDALAKITTYPGWEIDFKNAENAHFSYSIGLDFGHLVHILVEKERAHCGDRSHSRLVKLDSLILTYPGWQDDVRIAETAHFKDLHHAFLEHLETFQKKQRAFLSSRVDKTSQLPEASSAVPPLSKVGENLASYTCIICMEKPRSHAFVPCGHFASCEACATASMLQDNNRCPVCRQRVERAMRLYFS